MIYVNFFPFKIRRERNKKYKYAYVLHIKENHARKVSQHLGRLDQETFRPVRTAVWST